MEREDLPNKHFWLISVPKKDKGEDVFAELNRRTKREYAEENYKFDVPDLRVGTLDSLMSLSDDLQKIDLFVEGVVKKIGRQMLDLLGKERRAEAKFEINDTPMDNFVVRFKWEDARYPRRKTLNELSEFIQTQVAKLDEELKVKSSEYNNLITQINQRKKREAGSLVTRDLTNLVNPEDIVESEYLTTLLVVVPRTDFEQWNNAYETLTTFVLPRSSKLLHQDNEHGLFKVTLFKKAAEDFRNNARDKFKYTVRKYEPTESLNPEEQKKLKHDKERLQKSLNRWCNTNFAESFIAWIHLKCIRCFVESVLRYGLPAKFQAMLILPKKRGESKLREVLDQMYSDLGSKAYVSTADDEGLVGLTEKFYTYVNLDISLDLKYDKD